MGHVCLFARTVLLYYIALRGGSESSESLSLSLFFFFFYFFTGFMLLAGYVYSVRSDKKEFCVSWSFFVFVPVSLAVCLNSCNILVISLSLLCLCNFFSPVWYFLFLFFLIFFLFFLFIYLFSFFFSCVRGHRLPGHLLVTLSHCHYLSIHLYLSICISADLPVYTYLFLQTYIHISQYNISLRIPAQVIPINKEGELVTYITSTTMRAVTRNKLMNNLYLGTFLVAFSSVALGSILPCPAHTVDSESGHKLDNIDTAERENFHTKNRLNNKQTK